MVIRPISSIGGAGSTDLLDLDNAGCVHFVRNQEHSGALATSTRRADIEAMIQAARATGVANVVMDLGRLSYINSTGLGHFIMWHHDIKAAGGALVITGAVERIADILSMTQLDCVFIVVGTTAEAAEYFRARSGADGT